MTNKGVAEAALERREQGHVSRSKGTPLTALAKESGMSASYLSKVRHG